MRTGIRGMGWVTPLGSDLDGTWQRLLSGECGPLATLSATGKSDAAPPHHYFPATDDRPASRHPRLRRASTLSHLCASAGLAALAQAGLNPETLGGRRLAVVFAVTSGGVIYTRKFHQTIVQEGAHAASPLLFPETVYNAPASHLAALLGIDGPSYTLVGDSSAGISALHFAQQLLAADEADECLVVAGEEVDWATCAAYREWRLITPEPAIRIYQNRPRGMLLAEGAAALLLGRDGFVNLEAIHPGVPFSRRNAAAAAMQRVVAELTTRGVPELCVTSANGTFLDLAEATAIHSPILYNHKPALGEALGGSALIQTICAALALNRGEVPPVPHHEDSLLPLPSVALTGQSWERALVITLGLNQQASGLVLAAV